MSTRDGLWGFSTSNTIRLMSPASRGRDFGATAADDHRMLRLGDDPAVDVEEGRIGHDGAGPNDGIQEGGRPRFQSMGPSLCKRQRLELVRQEGEEVVQVRLLQRLWAHDPIDVAGPPAVHLARAGGGERLDRDDLPLLEGVMPVRDVRDALPRMKEVSFDRVARQIPDRTVSLRLDCPLDTLSDRTRLDARVHGLN